MLRITLYQVKIKARGGKITLYLKMIKKTVLLVLSLLFVFSLIFPSVSLATDALGSSKCSSNREIYTAIGCIPVLNSDGGTAFMGFILKWAVGVGGGIAFLLILYAGFLIMTSTGNPERLKAGQELMGSAISGLILLIFSVFILKFIGIDILGLCNFGFGTCPP
jgi:hypothetical protein